MLNFLSLSFFGIYHNIREPEFSLQVLNLLLNVKVLILKPDIWMALMLYGMDRVPPTFAPLILQYFFSFIHEKVYKFLLFFVVHYSDFVHTLAL